MANSVSGEINEAEGSFARVIEFLPRLNPQGITANPNLLIRLYDCPLFAGHLAAGNQSWIPAFGSNPITSLIIDHQHRVHATDLRIAFQRQIDGDRTRAAANRD